MGSKSSDALVITILHPESDIIVYISHLSLNPLQAEGGYES